MVKIFIRGRVFIYLIINLISVEMLKIKIYQYLITNMRCKKNLTFFKMMILLKYNQLIIIIKISRKEEVNEYLRIED